MPLCLFAEGALLENFVTIASAVVVLEFVLCESAAGLAAATVRVSSSVIKTCTSHGRSPAWNRYPQCQPCCCKISAVSLA